VHEQHGVDQVRDVLIAMPTLALTLGTGEAHRVEHNVLRSRTQLGARRRQGRPSPIERCGERLVARVHAHTDRERCGEQPAAVLTTARDVGRLTGRLIEQLRDAAIAEAVRHRKDRVLAVLVAEDVAELHAQRHRRGVAVVVR